MGTEKIGGISSGIRRAYYGFAFGVLEIGYTEEAVVSLERVAGRAEGPGEPSALSDRAFEQIGEYLAGRRRTFDFPYALHGTEFQRKVWAALCRIPYGETRTYKEIAQAVGNPKATRAVGMANNKNPMMIVVPCHRVIGADGTLVGYGGGLDMKKALLELEQGKALC